MGSQRSNRRKAPRARAPRAVTESQKSERRRAILAAADTHLREAGFEDFSMEVLARKLGFARGTLYIYFGTREELLLTLYEEKRSDWCEALIEATHPGISDDEFVQRHLECATADPLFLSLRAQLERVITHNVSTDRLLESKYLMREVIGRLCTHLAQCLELEFEDARHVVISFGALLLGASLFDSRAPAIEELELPADILATLESLSRDAVFSSNAILILEGIRRRRVEANS